MSYAANKQHRVVTQRQREAKREKLQTFAAFRAQREAHAARRFRVPHPSNNWFMEE